MTKVFDRLRSASGWTGGQYSLYRGLLGGLLCVYCLWLLADHGRGGAGAALALGALASLALAAGWRDRAAALALLVSGFWLQLAGELGAAAPSPWVGWLLLVHVCLPSAPYGAFDARGRADPDAGWRMARAWIALTWIVLLLGFAYGGWTPGLLSLLALSFDPAWLPPRGAPARIFYDGECGLCHRAVRFVLAEDRARQFRFAPLASASFAALVPRSERDALPDSIVLVVDSGERLVRSDALLRIGLGLGGTWRALAGAARLVPRPLRDAAYDGVARLRSRLFARPAEACPVVSAELRGRFDT